MNVPAEHVLHLPGVASVSWIAVLEPEDLRRDTSVATLCKRPGRLRQERQVTRVPYHEHVPPDAFSGKIATIRRIRKAHSVWL
jgi:hypothetical protein